VRNVASVGDVFLSAGLAFFLFASVVRPRTDDEGAPPLTPESAGFAGTVRLGRSIDAAIAGHSAIRGETGLVAGLAEASVLERPLILGGTGTGLASPALAPLPFEPTDQAAGPLQPLGGMTRPSLRFRANPYIQLALNGSFSALWSGQLISSFGDRIHQVALAFLVLGA